MVTFIFVTVLVSVVFVQGKTEVERLSFPKANSTHPDMNANAIGKAHYNAWTCNYKSEPGYKCISCSAALRCYPGNFSLLVQCGGFFPNCRNGYCSRWKPDGCSDDYTFAEGTHGPLRATTESNHVTMSSGEFLSGTTESVPEESRVTTDAIQAADSNKEENVTQTKLIETHDKPNIMKHPRRLL